MDISQWVTLQRVNTSTPGVTETTIVVSPDAPSAVREAIAQANQTNASGLFGTGGGSPEQLYRLIANNYATSLAAAIANNVPASTVALATGGVKEITIPQVLPEFHPEIFNDDSLDDTLGAIVDTATVPINDIADGYVPPEERGRGAGSGQPTDLVDYHLGRPSEKPGTSILDLDLAAPIRLGAPPNPNAAADSAPGYAVPTVIAPLIASNIPAEAASAFFFRGAAIFASTLLFKH